MVGEELLKEYDVKRHFCTVLSTTWLLEAYLSIKSLEDEERKTIEKIFLERRVSI